MPGRPLIRVPVPPGPHGVTALTAPLRAALDGTGPAIAPIPVVSPTTSTDYVEQLLRATRPDDAAYPLESEEVAVVLSTSGSTQNPKGVLHSRSSLTALSGAVLGGSPVAPQWIATLPLTSMGGFNVVLRALEVGLEAIAVPSLGGAGPFTPEDFAAAVRLAHERSTDVRVSLVAAQVRRLLADPAGTDALRACSQILVGGGPLPLVTARAASDAGVRLTTTYGATETAGGCVYDSVPLRGVRIMIDSHDGEIVLSGPMVALGYRCEPLLTAERFVDGGYRTGDIGTYDGALSITGRRDDVVTINGVNVAITAVEDALATCSGVSGAAVVALPDAGDELRLFAAVTTSEPVDDPAALRAQMRADVVVALGAAAAPRYFALVDELPMLPNGKIDRRALLELARNGAEWQR